MRLAAATRTCAAASLLVAAMLRAPLAEATSQYLTDDPAAVDVGHFETFLFSQWNNHAGAGSSTAGPAVEFNGGIAPGLELHTVAPIENVTAPGIANQHGFGDFELGFTYRFVTEKPNRPQIGIMPAVELPTGNAALGLGNGRPWYRLPIGLQKSWDDERWTFNAEAGIALNNAPGQRNYGFGGFLLQRAAGKALTVGAEVFTQGGTAIGETAATLYSVGATISPTTQFSILIDIGHSSSGASHSIGYAGVYYTFPKPKEP